MEKISIIIPAYNAEKYIGRCLESILRQTFPDFKVICVDDGSTDKTAEICRGYAERDERIAVVSKENGGAPAARNTGLQYAKGEYITFVDADDWLEPRMYEVLYIQAKENDADISVVGFSKDFESGSRNMENLSFVSENISGSEELIRYAFIRDEYRNFGAYVWNKLFHKRIIYSGDKLLRFDEELTRGDDVWFYAQAALLAQKAVYSGKHLYHYFQRDDSYTHAISLEKGEGILTAYEHVIELCKENAVTEETIKWVRRFYVYHASLLAEKAIAYGNREKSSMYVECIKRYLQDYLDTNERYPERIKRLEGILQHGGQ